MSLVHLRLESGVRGDVQTAYAHATMVEKRRRPMARRAEYLTGPGKGQVVQLAERRA